jgi:hypothetical protein
LKKREREEARMDGEYIKRGSIERELGGIEGKWGGGMQSAND